MAITKRLKNPSKIQAAVCKLISYIINPEKTSDEKALYVDSLNCSVIGAASQFKAVRDNWNKNSGNFAYHFVQSFSPNEVTAEEAHQCGMELAKVLFADLGFQVVVGTHLDKDHLHNHFAVNAVNSLDGKKLDTNHSFIRKMRSENDRICREHNLSVITAPKGKDKSYAEWLIDKNGGFTWRGAIRKDIDAIIPTVATFKALLDVLEAQGYTVYRTGKHLRISPPGTNTNFRMYKLGAGYSEEDITKRIIYSLHRVSIQPTASYRTVKQKNVRYKGTFSSIKKKSRFRGLYYCYLYRLRKLTKSSPQYRKRMPMQARHDAELLSEFSDDLRLLSKYKIDNVSQLADTYLFLNEKQKRLLSHKQDLKAQLRTCAEPDTLKSVTEQIDNLSKLLKNLRKELKSCERVYDRSKRIYETNKQISYSEIKMNARTSHSPSEKSTSGKNGEHKKFE